MNYTKCSRVGWYNYTLCGTKKKETIDVLELGKVILATERS